MADEVKGKVFLKILFSQRRRKDKSERSIKRKISTNMIKQPLVIL